MKKWKEYRLPITGTILNWETFSGDPYDPVRIVGLNEFSRNYMDWSDIDATERNVEVKIKRYNIDEGFALIDVFAIEDFHNQFSRWLEGKSYETICNLFNKPHLKITENNKRPEQKYLEVWL